MTTTSCREIAEWVRKAQQIVVFTGAGISTESGIPDFRSPGGIWSQTKPVYYQDFLESAEARHEYWRQKSVAYRDFADAQPNTGHEVLAQWESEGSLRAVITQNIDGLHQAAGSRRVLELHGTARSIECIDCKRRFEPRPLIELFLSNNEVPPCAHCGGRMKSATVSFGQMLPQSVLDEAIELSQQADLYFAIGSSLVVEPAASLPRLAKQSGARLVIVNRDPTDQDDSADAVIREGIGKTLSEIQACLTGAPDPRHSA